MAFRKKRQDPFQEIQNCLQKRDYKGAVNWFNTLLQKDPKNTQIRLRFADTLVLMGAKKDAVKQYGIVADELSEKGFMIRAIAINKKILQLDPKQTDVHDKLAAMSTDKSPTGTKSSLADALYRPTDPIRRSPAPAPPAAAPPPKPPPAPAPLPELSLEESMAMEFGEAGELVDAPPDAPPSEEPIALGAPPEDEDEVEVLEVVTLEPEPDVVLALEGIEPVPSEEPGDLVLDMSEANVEIAEDDVVAFTEGDDEEPEIEIIAFDVESEGELEPAEAESLLGALGEDIDSLIDSIIDDVGTSAQGKEEPDEPPPTHIPLFSDLTTSEFIAVAILLVRRVAKTGEIIVREGDPGDSMFIVSTGEVRATISKGGQQVPVATMRDGDFFGEMAVLTGEPRTATVTAVKATELLELSRENLQEICSRHPHVEAKIRLAYDERVSK
jgi:cAMP-dependent protein kinase regulator